jgi:hypothetical protein
MKEGVCKLCDQVRMLVKAHVISRRFFKDIKGDAPHAVFFDGSPEAKRTATYLRAGPYDEEILCEDCEPKFSELDRYGWEIFGSPRLDNPIPEFDGRAYRISCDTEKIRRFILSVLWRASVSKSRFYSHVRLGPYEKKIKDRIFDPTPLQAHEFPTVILHFNQAKFGVYAQTLFPPLRERHRGGLNVQVLYLPNLKILVHMDQRVSAEAVGPFWIQRPDYFVLVELPTSKMRERDFIPAMARSFAVRQRLSQSR